MINIGTRRECFFDDFLIDKEKTSAQFFIHHPIAKEIMLKHDEEWEGNGCDFHNFFYDEEINAYRMYYVAWDTNKYHGGNTPIDDQIKVCYAESKDGINWTRPNLGICSYKGSKENNIILDRNFVELDNLYVFKDKNPECPKEQRYKGILKYEKSLYSLFSEDGIHFQKGVEITNLGAFDSLNVVMWDENEKIYRGYMRGFHVEGDFLGEDEFDNRPLDISDEERNIRVRDIRYIESKDFKTWSTPKLLNFGDQPDYPLYTNCASLYYRAPHMIIGFPTRYNERKEWSKSFEELCTKEIRKDAMKMAPRFGLAITDCLFMCSRNGIDFTRYLETFMRPGPEFNKNWVYGSCYPAIGFLVTKSDVKEDCDDEISMLVPENHWSNENKVVRRYTIRQDGFVSLHAGGKEEIITTKPFIFEGSKLYANISTSAAGYMYFEISTKDGKTIKSCEMFGDSVDKLIGFDEDLSAFAGKEVVLTVRMMDADLYSIKFER